MPSGELQEGVLPTSLSEFHQTSDSAATLISSPDSTNLDWFEPYFPFTGTEPQFYQSNDSQHGYQFDPTVFPFCGTALTLSSHDDSRLLQAEKAEKQRKLRELQEAARKLEEELSVA